MYKYGKYRVLRDCHQKSFKLEFHFWFRFRDWHKIILINFKRWSHITILLFLFLFCLLPTRPNLRRYSRKQISSQVRYSDIPVKLKAIPGHVSVGFEPGDNWQFYANKFDCLCLQRTSGSTANCFSLTNSLYVSRRGWLSLIESKGHESKVFTFTTGKPLHVAR